MAVVAQEVVVDLVDQLLAFLFTCLAAQNLVDLGLQPVVVLLRRWRAEIEEIGEPHDLPQQLKELGLPVVEGLAQDLVGERDELGRLTLIARLLGEVQPAEIPLQRRLNEKERQRNPSVAVFAEDAQLAGAALDLVCLVGHGCLLTTLSRFNVIAAISCRSCCLQGAIGARAAPPLLECCWLQL